MSKVCSGIIDEDSKAYQKDKLFDWVIMDKYCFHFAQRKLFIL